MSPRLAREILLKWVRGEPRAPSRDQPPTETACQPGATVPSSAAPPCPLDATQRQALYRLITRDPTGAAQCPPLKPEYLPPP
jgi:hypothetical protein